MPSSVAVAKKSPSRLQITLKTVLACTSGGPTGCPELVSQTRTFASAPPVKVYLPSVLKVVDRMELPCGSCLTEVLSPEKSHKRALPSAEPVSNRRPSGETSIDSIAPAWVKQSEIGYRGGGCQTRAVPLAVAASKRLPSGSKSTLTIAPSSQIASPTVSPLSTFRP